MTYCSTDLSATSPLSYRQFINRFSTTCPPACQPDELLTMGASEGQNPRATARLQFFSRERESVNRLTGMIGHFHLPAAARFDSTVHLPDDFAA
jgi:hypothetical protein